MGSRQSTANKPSLENDLPRMPRRRIIFLDVDGVLNSDETLDGVDGVLTDCPGPELLANLKYVIDGTHAEIVLSSTWRLNERKRRELDGLLGELGLRIVGMTPDLTNTGDRVDEIMQWLSEQAILETAAYLAIDDMALDRMNDKLHSEHFVKTSFAFGLTLEKAKEAVDKMADQLACEVGLRELVGGATGSTGQKKVVVFNSTEPPTAAQATTLASRMPQLAGRPLEPPQFHRTNWHANQRFTQEDDPDRTNEPWQTPEFVYSKDPAKQRAETTVEELPMPKGNRSYSSTRSFARVVRNAVSEEDCASLLSRFNAKGLTPALLNIGHGRQQLAAEVRDGHRVIIDSPDLVAWLFEVLRPHLPEELDDGSRLVGLNERVRFLCYTPGQSFEEHNDGMYIRPHGQPRAGDRSHITVQLYLHDVPKEHGGATTFFPSGLRSDPEYSVKHQPEVGSVLLFTQDLPHEGSLVKEGLKYTLRTEVMYAAPPSRVGGLM